MGVASLILGILSVILAFVPFIWIISIITAIVGLILGILALVRKTEKGKSIAGIILCVITILLVIVTLKDIFNTFDNTEKTTSTNIETGKQETTTNDELKKNITVEAIGLTENGDFAFKIKNNNKQAVFIDTVNTIFKDENGNFMEKVQSNNQYFGIGANSEIINYASGYDTDFSKYPNYEFETELSSEWMAKDIVVDNFEIISNNTGKQISVQVKNNNNIALSDITVIVAYYRNGSIVGCQNGYAYDTTTQANGTAYINVSYPKDLNYDEISFDKYETYLIEAEKEY